MTSGTVTMTPAAICSPKGAWNSVAPVNFEMATVAVCSSGLLTIESAMMNSFQLWMKVRIAVVKTPGAASGSRILRNACHLVQPSIMAASSKSKGSAFINVVRFQTASGMAKDRLGTIIAW